MTGWHQGAAWDSCGLHSVIDVIKNYQCGLALITHCYPPKAEGGQTQKHSRPQFQTWKNPEDATFFSVSTNKLFLLT